MQKAGFGQFFDADKADIQLQVLFLSCKCLTYILKAL